MIRRGAVANTSVCSNCATVCTTDSQTGLPEGSFSAGMPARVRELEIPERDLPPIAQDTLKNFNANRSERPPDYVEQMLELLRACW